MFNFEYLVPFLIGVLLAITMGGSGTGPSFSAAYGSNLIKRAFIPGMFGLFVFIGAVAAGENVSITMGKGIIQPEKLTIVLTTIIFTAVAITLFIANKIGVPQSTSQSTVFALAAPGIYFGSFESGKLFTEIIPAWFILPAASFIITFFASRSFLLISCKEFFNRHFQNKKFRNNRIIKFGVVASCCYVAFAIGSNNVANISGPLATMTGNKLGISTSDSSFSLLLLMTAFIIAPNFGIGSSLFGYKVVKNSGKAIVTFGPLAAILIGLVTATLLLVASVTKGIPTSLVQLNLGAIIALGIVKNGWKKTFSNKTLKSFWLVWLVAPIFSFIISLLLILVAQEFELI